MSDFPKIPGYKITKILGKGGMGIVYLAVQEALDRQVALKVTLPSLYEQDETFLTRFVREAKATAMLQHPNIITIYDAGVFENSSYMAMEYISTGTLADLKRDALSHNKICKLFIGIAKGLGVAHQAGLVHRDIKPDNILIDKDGLPLVTDFGIVKTQNANATLTKVGDTIGTPHYMSPEQIKAEKLDGRSDLYSLGIVLYNYLEGGVPFSDTTPSAVYIKHVTEEPPPLSTKNAAFQSIISKALEKDPQDRFNNANEMVVALEAIMQVLHTPAPSPAIKPSEISQARTKMVKPITEVPQSSGYGLKIALLSGILALGVGSYFAYDKFFKTNDTPNTPPQNTTELTANNEKAGIIVEEQETPTQKDTENSENSENSNNSVALNEDDSNAQLEQEQSDFESPASSMETTNQSPDDVPADEATTVDETEITQEAAITQNNETENNEEENNKPIATETLLIDKLPSTADDELVEKIPTQDVALTSPAENQLLKIKNLLAAANAKLQKSKLLRPIGDNAYEKYNQVLALDASNRLAKLGIIKIIKKYQSLAQQQLAQNNYNVAISYINSALTIRQKFDKQGYGNNMRPIITRAYSINRLQENKQKIIAQKNQALDDARQSKREQERLAKINQQKQQKPQINPNDLHEKGLNALKIKDYSSARKYFKQAADLGHIKAQNQMGRIYLRELGVRKDYAKALSWFLKAAKQGYAPAQDNLGLMYFKGYGTKKDFDESFFWYAKAANQGYADSQGILGAMYEYGRGVRKNSYQAVQWYKKAAKQGNEFAIKKLRKRGISKYD